MEIAAAGDRALLVQLGDVSAPQLHAAGRRARQIEGVVACIVGHSSLYVLFGAPPGKHARGELMSVVSDDDASVIAGSHHSIRTSFADAYAPDLPELLHRLSQNRDDFLKRLSQLQFTARYLGFRGGFAYLDGWPADWAMPRQPTSRPVASGSFAIGGGVAGFYPLDTPGGWNLLGRTGQSVENRFAAGDTIAIEPTLDTIEMPPSVKRPRRTFAGIEVTTPLAHVVTAPDWTRLGRGLPAGGPFDDVAAAAANRAVGNEPGAAVLELAMAGTRLRGIAGIAAWYGSQCDLRLDGRAVHDPRQFEIRDDEELSIGRITSGLRGYLAVGKSRGEVATLERDDRLLIHVMRGPDDVDVNEIECDVTPQLDRAGIRLRPLKLLDVRIPADLQSIGMQCGTIQLHPDGSIVAMGPDHPVTGGYLQPMTVLSGERWKLAQLMPGERVKFVAAPSL